MSTPAVPSRRTRAVAAVAFLAIATVIAAIYGLVHQIESRGEQNAKPCAAIAADPPVPAPPPSTRCQLEQLQHDSAAQASAAASEVAELQRELASARADEHHTADALAGIEQLLTHLQVVPAAGGGGVQVIYVPSSPVPSPTASTSTPPATHAPTASPTPPRRPSPAPSSTAPPAPAPPTPLVTSLTCQLLHIGC